MKLIINDALTLNHKMLYIFDLDGTLVEKYGTQPLQNVHAYLERLEAKGHKLAIATNQAGLAWRRLTKATKFPDVQSMARRFDQIAQDLTPLAQVPWFVSVFDNRVKLHANQYENLCLDLASACPQLSLIVKADPQWRKPQPGMLLSAGQYYNLDPGEMMFVGDYKTDEEAAATAGIRFAWADAFFDSSLA